MLFGAGPNHHIVSKSDQPVDRGHGMRILVVEDDKKVASFLEKGLREEGYSVDVAHDGDDGLMKAHVHDYDLLLLDVMLPGKTGFEIVRELRTRENAVPVLMLTARDAQEDVVMGLDAGADDYLTKPFGFGELVHFADLLEHPEREVRRVASFLDVSVPERAWTSLRRSSSSWSSSSSIASGWSAGRSFWRRCGTSTSIP